MSYYRVMYDGYIEGEFESEDEAVDTFIEGILDNELDIHGRHWTEFINVEKLDE